MPPPPPTPPLRTAVHIISPRFRLTVTLTYIAVISLPYSHNGLPRKKNWCWYTKHAPPPPHTHTHKLHNACCLQNPNSPILWIQCNGTGLVQTLPEEDLSIGAIQIAHFNSIGLRVCPVQLLPQPITRQAIRGDYASGDHIHTGLGAEM